MLHPHPQLSQVQAEKARLCSPLMWPARQILTMKVRPPASEERNIG